MHNGFFGRSLLSGLAVLGLGFSPLCLAAVQAETVSEKGTKHVADSHWAWPALKYLNEVYQLDLVSAQGQNMGQNTGQKPVNRFELAVILSKVLKALEAKQQVLAKEDQALINRLKTEFAAELEARYSALDERTEVLEDQSDLQNTQLQDLLERVDQLTSIRAFGSLALRFCGMSTRLGDFQNFFGSNVTGSTFQVRLGAGLQGRIQDSWDWQVRVLSNDNRSYNLSWFPFGGDHIPRSPINLDRFFIRYQPQELNQGKFKLALTVGKAPNFLSENELLLDEDVSFSGLQQQLSWRDLTPFWPKLDLELGQYAVLVEETFVTTSLLAAKLSSEFKLAEPLSLRLGSSYSHYLKADNLARFNFNQGYQGIFSARNRGADKNDFESEFRLLNGFAQLRLNLWEQWPVILQADYLRNLGSADKNQGWWAGLQVGELKGPGSWQFKYAYRGLEQDANLSLMVDENLAGTDVSGHHFDAAVQLAAKTSLSVSLFTRTSLSDPSKDHLYVLYTTLRQDF
jgi:hypothetical protein